MNTPDATQSARPWQILVGMVTVVLLSGMTATATAAATVATAPSPAALATTRALNTKPLNPNPMNPKPVNTAGFPSGGRNPGIFTDTCARTQTAPNDPIQMPGRAGLSMQHDFFGNRAINASSTAKQLVGGPSSCSTTADASAYWTPVLYAHGSPLAPKSTLIYWRAPAASAPSVKTMPAGISMIAGNETATAPQSDRIINWTCSTVAGESAARPGTAPRDCAPGHSVRLVITFPNCWDGHRLDGRAQTNVVYAESGGHCPASHPVQIPQIVMHLTYPTSSAAGLTLSIDPTRQGPTVTGHADFLDGWTPSRMNADVAACIDTQTRCGLTVGPLATPTGGRPASVIRP